MASVRKRKWMHNGVENEAWVVNYTDQGGKRRLKTFEKKKDADRHRTLVETEIEKGIHAPLKESVTVKEAGAAFVRHLDGKHHAKEITKHYVLFVGTALNRFVIPKLGTKRLSEVSRDDVQAVLDEMKPSYSARYVKQIHHTISTLIKFGVRKRWVRRHVLADEPCELPVPEKRTAVPTKADIIALLASLDTPLPGERLHVRVNRKLAVNLGIFCGLRPGEICALRWEDINISGGFLRVSSNMSRHDGMKAPKTKAGKRVVPLTAPVISALKEAARLTDIVLASSAKRFQGRHITNVARYVIREFDRTGLEVDLSGREGFVLVSGRDSPRPKELSSRFWWSVAKRAGLWDKDAERPKFTPHALRHAAASLWIEAGMPAANLKAAIGHASISTTYDIYGHLFPEDRRTFDIANAVAASFAATTERQQPATH